AAIEILILSYDILDDIEDDDCKGKPWLTETQDSSLVLNATTALLFTSQSVIMNTDFKNKEIAISILLYFSLQSINGQQKVVLNICMSEAEYIDMTIKKSGSLVALSCLIGAVLATCKYPKEIEMYSYYIGVVGQINNDLEDIKSTNDKNDILNKKLTLPIIYILNIKDKKHQIFYDYFNDKIDKEVFLKSKDKVYRNFIESGAIVYTKVIKKIYQTKIKNQLEKLDIKQNQLNLLLKYIN